MLWTNRCDWPKLYCSWGSNQMSSPPIGSLITPVNCSTPWSLIFRTSFYIETMKFFFPFQVRSAMGLVFWKHAVFSYCDIMWFYFLWDKRRRQCGECIRWRGQRGGRESTSRGATLKKDQCATEVLFSGWSRGTLTDACRTMVEPWDRSPPPWKCTWLGPVNDTVQSGSTGRYEANGTVPNDHLPKSKNTLTGADGRRLPGTDWRLHRKTRGWVKSSQGTAETNRTVRDQRGCDIPATLTGLFQMGEPTMILWTRQLTNFWTTYLWILCFVFDNFFYNHRFNFLNLFL